MEKIWNVFTQLKDQDGRDLSLIFMDLPPKDIYPDYYQFIPSPICFNIINNKLYRGEYSTFLDFEKDIELLCKNAQTYNQEGSWVYNDSLRILKELSTQKNKLFNKQVETLKEEVEEEEEDEEEEIDIHSDIEESNSNSGNEKSQEGGSDLEESNSNSEYNNNNSFEPNNGFDEQNGNSFINW